MGVVYEAEDVTLGRRVALKFLPENLTDDPLALERFRREARAASALNHPNICTIYEIAEDNGRTFIAMELMEGATLKHRITTKQMPLEEGVPEFSRHTNCRRTRRRSQQRNHPPRHQARQYFRHQSRSCENSRFRTWPKRSASPRFSRCRSCNPPRADARPLRLEDQLSSPGTAVGTVAYMSPEQARGKELDARTDLFSFGAVLYEMSTGARPFRGETWANLFEAILHKAPVPPTLLNPELPPSLEEIIRKALEKDRDLRYLHASEMASDLKRLKRDLSASDHLVAADSSARISSTGRRTASGQRISIAKTSTTARVQQAAPSSGVARKILGIMAAVLVLLAIAAGGIYKFDYSLWQRVFGPKIPEQKNLVVLPFSAIDAQPLEQIYCDGLTETVTAKMASLPSLQVASSREVRAHRVGDIQTARARFGANLVLTASWQQLQNSARINLSLIDAKTGQQLRTATVTEPSNDLLGLQDRVVLTASHMLQLEMSKTDASSLTAHDTNDLTAYDFYVQGIGYLQRQERPENVDNAIIQFQHSIAQDRSYAQAHAGLAEAYWDKYQLTKDPQWAEKSKAAVSAARDLNSQLPEVQMAIAATNLRTGNYSDALAGFQHVVEVDPQNATAYSCSAAVTMRSAVHQRPNNNSDTPSRSVHNAGIATIRSGFS